MDDHVTPAAPPAPDVPTGPARAGPADPARARRRARLAAAAVLLLLAALGVGGWFAWRWFTTPPPAPAPPDIPLDGVDAEAAELVRRALANVRHDPRSASAWGELAETLHYNDLTDYAGPCYDRAETLAPTSPRWPYLHAALIARTDRDAAEPLLRRAVDLAGQYDPYGWAASLTLAERLLARGESDEAEQLLSRVAAQDAADPRLQYDLGLLAFAHDSWREAADHFLRAAPSPSARRKAHAQLAMVYRRLNDDAAAEAAAARAGKLPPDVPWPDPYLAEAAERRADTLRQSDAIDELVRRGKREEVAELMRQLPDLAGDHRPLVFLGMAEMQLHHYGPAEEAFRRVLERDPGHLGANYWMASLRSLEAEELRSQKASEDTVRAKYAEAVGYADRALRTKADNYAALLRRGLCLRELGRRDEAVECLREAVRCRQDFSEGHLRLGETLAQAGRTDEAESELKQALDLANGDKERAEAQALLDHLRRDKPAP
jgi:tetratricopeptide (TPR) repeat protein